MPDGVEECGQECPAGCGDRCNRPAGHVGYHVSADDVCIWTPDNRWAGPGNAKEVRLGD